MRLFLYQPIKHVPFSYLKEKLVSVPFFLISMFLFPYLWVKYINNLLKVECDIRVYLYLAEELG